jgi:hypothetical protein
MTLFEVMCGASIRSDMKLEAVVYRPPYSLARPIVRHSTLSTARLLAHARVSPRGAGMAKQQEVLFDERFLDKHAGAIIADTAVAIVELS